MNRNRYIFALLLAILAIPSLIAQVKIHGKVIDADNEPLEFATVRIAGTAIGTNTGLDGGYSLSVAEQDTIEVVFTCIGFREEKRKLYNAKGDVTLNMRMQRTSNELQEVEVSEFKKQTGSILQIDADAYMLAPDVSGGSVESLLTTMAGVNSSNEMSSQYSSTAESSTLSRVISTGTSRN